MRGAVTCIILDASVSVTFIINYYYIAYEVLLRVLARGKGVL